jgi:hypothetical protein
VSEDKQAKQRGRFTPPRGHALAYASQVGTKLRDCHPDSWSIGGSEHATADHQTIANAEARPLGSMVLHAFRRREERVVMPRRGVSNHCMAAA